MGFYYGTSSVSMNLQAAASAVVTPFSATLTGLTPSTTYYYKAYATVGGTGAYVAENQTFYGATATFTTPDNSNKGPYLGCMEVPTVMSTPLSTTSSTYGAEYAASVEGKSNQYVITHEFSIGSADHRNYTMLYDKSKYAALWLAYPLNSSLHLHTLSVSASRPDNWSYDPATAYLPTTSQINVTNNSYPERRDAPESTTSNKYDRGHQIPNADRSYCSSDAQMQTFFVSNQLPQYWSFNQGKWQNLESKTREWAAECDTLYVVTGPMYKDVSPTTTADNSGKNIPVPTHYFKVLLKCSWSGSTLSTVKGIGFIMENVANTDVTDYTTAGSAVSATSFNCGYMSIGEVETVTGYTFYDALPAEFSAAKSNSTPSAFTSSF